MSTGQQQVGELVLVGALFLEVFALAIASVARPPVPMSHRRDIRPAAIRCRAFFYVLILSATQIRD